ncbi:MAG: hypothetical protein ACTSWL_01755 [Promethearchaeota archaeon]
MGKNPENTMQLTGVNMLLSRFIHDLQYNLQLLSKHKIQEFLEIYENTFKLDLKPTLNRINANFEGMGGIEVLSGQETILYYMVLTKLLEALREKAYQKWGFSQIKEQISKISKHKIDNDTLHKIQHLAALNEQNISLLYNLSFIRMLVEIYGSKKFNITMKRLISLRVNRIIKLIQD